LRLVEVVVIAPLSGDDLAAIRSIDSHLHVDYAWDLFGPELVADWPSHTAEWYLPRRFREARDTTHARRQRDALLAAAEVVCITFPFPTRLVGRAPRLQFVHQLPAGVSNLVRGDLWRTHVPVTSGRGAGNTLPIAEWAIAAALALCKEFPRALVQGAAGGLDRAPFRGRQVAGKTLGVVGLGGIGSHVARLGAALGMRAIGTRRSPEPVERLDSVFPPSKLDDMLAASDIVVLCTQLTQETHHLIDRDALAAMRPGAFLINVARGELIDETALLEALHSGYLGGFAADVYEGEFEHQPPPELLAHENVILTPHTSGQTEHPSPGSLEIFRENIRRCLAGQPLRNLVDWQRGY
jgi:phosphoglycerate dehydrogenase-like enzyme